MRHFFHRTVTQFTLERSIEHVVSTRIDLGLLRHRKKSPQDSGRDGNRLISTVFRNGLSVLSIGVAAIVLAALLLMSGNPIQTNQQRVEAEMRYLSDLESVLMQSLDATWEGAVETKTTLYQLAENYELVLQRLREDTTAAYQPSGLLANLRTSLVAWFGRLSRGEDIGRQTLLDQTAALTADGAQLARLLRNFGASQSHQLNAMSRIQTEANELIGNLRSRGNDNYANLLFSVEASIESRLTSRNLEEVGTIDAIVDGIRSPEYTLTASDRVGLESFATQAQGAAEWRMSMIQSYSEMNLPKFVSDKAHLQELLAASYVKSLSLINDARVLLNVYTVMLLLALAYFGFRLSRSHKALNISHDGLERRVQDRTKDLEQALTDLQESQVQLVQAEKMSSLGQLVAGVMHEINTPLLYVLNNTSLTADAVCELDSYIKVTLPLVDAEDDAQRKELLAGMSEQLSEFDAEMIGENAQEIAQLSEDSVEGLHQISELVQSLKDFSRLDRAAEDRFNVVDGIEKTLVITRNLWKYGIEIEREFEDVPDIFCSPSRLNQVFINLITNAVQAMEGKGDLKLAVTSRNDWVEVTIEDTGCGIPQEHITKIMDPFFTTKPVGQGTGLGLSIVHQIVEEHQGQLLVDSKEGIGTRFTLGFPVRRSGTGSSEKEVVSSVAADGAATNGTDQSEVAA